MITKKCNFMGKFYPKEVWFFPDNICTSIKNPAYGRSWLCRPVRIAAPLLNPKLMTLYCTSRLCLPLIAFFVHILAFFLSLFGTFWRREKKENNHLSCVTCHESHVKCHKSHVRCNMSHVLYHMSHVTCHLSLTPTDLPQIPC